MKTESLMSKEELDDTVVKYAWEQAQENILKQTQYAIASELSARGNARGRQLVNAEIDKLLKPRLESLHSDIEAGVQRVTDRIQDSIEYRVREGIRYAIDNICDHIVREVLNQAAYKIRTSLKEAVDEDEQASKE
jgi:hypothetical protein